MFFKLAMRNSRRSRKENGLFFASLVVSIVAFYIILALSHQDVMIFLRSLESDAVNSLLQIAAVFYVFSLVMLFFLIYYASKYQLERRRHELGMYIMMGMRRSKLFALLMAEDLGSSVVALLIGLPIAILVSEVVSLLTARLVGLGVIGHHVSFSLQAVILTTVGFVAIKLAAFLILSGKLARKQIGDLLVDTPETEKKQLPAPVYGVSAVFGLVALVIAYCQGIGGYSWISVKYMAVTITLGFVGMFLLFFGLRLFIDALARRANGSKPLAVFGFRQIHENVVTKSGTLAISSILILGALCCCGSGVGICISRQNMYHVLDYTFASYGDDAEADSRNIRAKLEEAGVLEDFSDVFDMKLGYIKMGENESHDDAVNVENVISELEKLKASEDRDVLINNMSYMTYPYLIQESAYNKVLEAAGKEPLELGENELALYTDFFTDYRGGLLNEVLAERPEVDVRGDEYHLIGEVQTTKIVTDSSITLSFGLIVDDDTFARLTNDNYELYVNAILKKDIVDGKGLMKAIMDENEKLDGIDFESINADCESYLQNIGRNMFYTVAAGYITLYLAVVFLIIANTIIGVQFLMGQRKSGRRYRTLVKLGATYEMLCSSANRQVGWYFGIPVAVAAVSSIFGVRALLTGILSEFMRGRVKQILIIAAVMIILLCVVEYIYMTAVKRSSNRYLMAMMTPERVE
jgi:predicted ABC-type transport system involved in lysophospholipase L1 biosynthesis, permease component